MGVAVAQLALTDAAIQVGTVDPDRIGISFGTAQQLRQGIRLGVAEAQVPADEIQPDAPGLAGRQRKFHEIAPVDFQLNAVPRQPGAFPQLR